MKTFIIALVLFSSLAFAKEMKNFNKDLFQNVQKDIQNDNDDQFKKRTVGRGPASVDSEPEGKYIEQEKKIDKNVRQLGTQKW